VRFSQVQMFVCSREVGGVDFLPRFHARAKLAPSESPPCLMWGLD
jgi:hypothetical protein